MNQKLEFKEAILAYLPCKHAICYYEPLKSNKLNSNDKNYQNFKKIKKYIIPVTILNKHL